MTGETERLWDEGASGLQTLSRIKAGRTGKEWKERKQRKLNG